MRICSVKPRATRKEVRVRITLGTARMIARGCNIQKPPATTSALQDFNVEDREAALADISITACSKKVQLTPNKLILRRSYTPHHMF